VSAQLEASKPALPFRKVRLQWK